jgi:hypothetical protein
LAQERDQVPIKSRDPGVEVPAGGAEVAEANRAATIGGGNGTRT